MPIVHFHLVDGQATKEQEAALLIAASELYADVLQCPMDRVRAFIQTFAPSRCAVAGKLVADDGTPAPYFEFLALEGRPLDQRQTLLAGFTDLLVKIIGAERASIRGHCQRVLPEEWAIGGTPASIVRKEHIATLTAGPSP